MDILKLFGLPAHPLLVHISVIAIPVLAVWLLLFVLLPRKRAGWIWPLAVLTVVTVVSTILTAGSGERFFFNALGPDDQTSPTLLRHKHLGDQLRLMVIVFGIVTLLYLVVEWRRQAARDQNGQTRPNSPLATAALALSLAVLVLGGLSTVWVVRTGHAGSTSAWGDTIPSATANAVATPTP